MFWAGCGGTLQNLICTLQQRESVWGILQARIVTQMWPFDLQHKLHSLHYGFSLKIAPWSLGRKALFSHSFIIRDGSGICPVPGNSQHPWYTDKDSVCSVSMGSLESTQERWSQPEVHLLVFPFWLLPVWWKENLLAVQCYLVWQQMGTQYMTWSWGNQTLRSLLIENKIQPARSGVMYFEEQSLRSRIIPFGEESLGCNMPCPQSHNKWSIR